MSAALNLTAATRAAALVLSATEGEYSPEDWNLAEDVIRAAAPHILTAAGKVVSEDDCRRIMGQVVADQMATVIFDERKRITDAVRTSTVLMTRSDGSEVAAVQWSALLEALGLKP